MSEISLAIAFGAGLVSFLSPCVLPIVPGFLAYLAGSSGEAKPGRAQIFLSSVFFVLGFAVIFSVLGVLLQSVLENVAGEVTTWLARVGGALIIFFGLYLVGLIKIPFLEQTHTVRVTRSFGSRHITSFVFGAAFAVGWTPCVGAALGAILGLAASSPALAFPLLLSYTLGLGVPFLLVGLFASQAADFISKFERSFKYISMAFGIILILLGVLVFTESLNLIANFEFVNRIILR